MTRGIVAGYVLGLILTGAAVTWAQSGGCGPGNPNCVVPTPPLTDNSNRAANTSWIQQQMYLTGVSSTTPSGPAGGSLSGNYPNPIVATSAIGVTQLGVGAAAGNLGPAGGALAGTYPNPTLVAPVIIQSAVPSASAVGLTTASPINLTSVSLPAGIYDISATVYFNQASTTVIQALVSGINATSATLPTTVPGAFAQYSAGGVGDTAPGFSAIQTQVIGSSRITLSAGSTTEYLVVQGNFNTSTLAAWGVIRAQLVK